ncbi:MAG: M60 family metallopeptidase, partial [Planctomycetota bacterium]|nr:M60 family metallopeptidase [Planctomycetota bacterium]
MMYVQLQQAFGWETFKKIFQEYRTLKEDERPRTDDEERDQWMVRFSKTTGKNLGPFFQAWNVPTSKAARESIKELPAWMPEGFPPGE